jgi:hypothetical protein
MTQERTASSLAALMFLAGCTDLTAVNTTAGQMVTAASTWNAVADEFQASCVRRNQVSTEGSDCAGEKKATEGLEAANKILAAYFTALQQASTSSNFSVDPGITKLSSSVQNIPGINAKQVGAVTDVASFFADMATKAMEERTLEKLVTNGAPKAEASIDVMSEFVVPALGNILNREKMQTLAAFSSYINESGTTADLRKADCSQGLSTSTFNTGTGFLLGQAYCTKITNVTTKLSALDNYKKSLATVSMSLKELESGKDKLDAKALAQQLVTDASSLNDDIEKINKAF